MERFLEIACFNLKSVQLAASAKVDRIELCVDASVGGTTPSLSLLHSAKAAAGGIPINVMTRPRGGSFVHTDDEFDAMKYQLQSLRDFADGFVFGILNSDGCVDEFKNKELVCLAEGKPCTFHRAFDEVVLEGMDEALETIARCGFKAVLTSGGAASAIEGKNVLGKLVNIASQKHEISIIVGGGVRSSNLKELCDATGAKWYHSSALPQGAGHASTKEMTTMLSILTDS